jgi:hypothetical protein
VPADHRRGRSLHWHIPVSSFHRCPTRQFGKTPTCQPGFVQSAREIVLLSQSLENHILLPAGWMRAVRDADGTVPQSSIRDQQDRIQEDCASAYGIDYSNLNVHDGIRSTFPLNKMVIHNGDSGVHAGDEITNLYSVSEMRLWSVTWTWPPLEVIK